MNTQRLVRVGCVSFVWALLSSGAVQVGGSPSVTHDPITDSIPSGPGWHEIPNTQMAPNCPNDPSLQGNTGCQSVIAAWGGAIADTTGNRMILWGGGHNDYYGNEVYALNLGANPITMTRLTNPSAFNNACTEAQADGNPTSRHTYDGLAYMPNVNKMYAFSGAKANCGYGSNDTWTFDLSSFAWARKDPTNGGPPGGCAGCVTDYDPNTGLVFMANQSELWSYSPVTNTYTRLNANAPMDYHLTGAIDQGRKMFFILGGPGQFWAFDISAGHSHGVQDWSRKVRGCDRLVHASYPGLAYDPVQKVMVGWAGGDTVYLFNPDARTCTAENYPGGPGPAAQNGTNGRFRYFPAIDAFIVVNNWEQNAFALRLPRPAASTLGTNRVGH